MKRGRWGANSGEFLFFTWRVAVMAEVVADRLAAAAAVGDAALRNRDVAPLANGRAPTFLGLWHISQFKASFLPPLQSKFRLTRRTASSNENLCKNFFF